MKKVGIIGGIGWPSTIEYYRLICEASQKYHKDKTFSGPTPMPEISIESLNMNFTVNNRGSSEPDTWHIWDTYFQRALSRLENNGADLILLASMTPHARLSSITEVIKVPIISIYDAIATYCNRQEINRLLALGTMPTMTSPAFETSMANFGIKVINPPTEDLKVKVVKVIDMLYRNQTEGSSVAIDKIVRACIPDDQLTKTAICLGCTELPLAFAEFTGDAEFEYKGVTYLNTTIVHAMSAFEACISST